MSNIMVNTTRIVALFFVVISAASFAQSTPKPALIGLWNFQTATGTENGKDVITAGVMQISPNTKGAANGVSATIVWLDEKGIARTKREVEGRFDQGGVVFSQASVRTASSANGREINTAGEVVWVLRANSLTLPAVIPLPPAPPERGASTAEERARVVQMAIDSEREPRQIHAKEHAWLRQWIEEIPDFDFNFKGTTITWLKGACLKECSDILEFQFMASAMAFQITHPAHADDSAAISLAGMEGALRAYEKLVSSDSALRSAKLEQALIVRNKNNKGEMEKFVFALSGRDSETSATGLRTATTNSTQDTNVRRIIDIAKADPQVMHHLDVLSNRFGGRMIGSDAYTHAANWAKTQLSSWGLQAQLELAGQMPVGFNRGPSSGRIVNANSMSETLRFGTPAYTSGTKGVQTGAAMIAPSTLAELAQRQAQFKGTWVLLAQESGGTGRDGEHKFIASAFTKKLMEIGVLGTIQSAAEPLSIASAAPTTWENLPTFPDIKLAASQFEAIKAKLKNSEPVRLEFDIRNWFYPGPVPYHNVVAKIQGTQ